MDKSIGNISASYIYAYPPGIPLLIPGEVINRKVIEQIKYLKKEGIDLSIDNMEIPIIDWQKYWLLLILVYRKQRRYIWKELLL